MLQLLRWRLQHHPKNQLSEQWDRISANNDVQGTKDLIQTYKTLLNKNQLTGNERNIDYWRKQGFDAFKEFVVGKSQVPTATAVKRKQVPGKAINLVDNIEWLIVIPLDKDASCFHGKKSDWCTTKPFQEYFEDYFYDKSVTLIYCLNQRNGGMWAIAAHKDTDEIEMFDQQDNSLNVESFRSETGLDPEALTKQALGKTYQPQIASSRKEYTDALDTLGTRWVGQDFSNPVPEIEKLLLKTKKSSECSRYIRARINSASRSHGPDSRITLPKAILMSACVEDDNCIKYVEPSMLTDSTIFQLYKRNRNILPHITEALLTNKLSHELISHIIKEYPRDIRELLTQGIVIPDDILINEMKAVNFSKDNGYYSSKASMGNEMAVSIISNMCKNNIHISKLVIDVAVETNGSVVGWLLGEGYDLSESQLLAACKSNGSAIEAIMDRNLVTPKMQLYALASSKGDPYIFGIICKLSKGELDDTVISEAMKWEPLKSFNLLVKYDQPIKPEYVNAATNPDNTLVGVNDINRLLDYVIDNPEYLTPSNIDNMLKMSKETAIVLAGAACGRNPKIKLSHETLVKLANNSRLAAADILNATKPEDLTEDLQLAIAKHSVLINILLKKVPNISNKVLEYAMTNGT